MERSAAVLSSISIKSGLYLVTAYVPNAVIRCKFLTGSNDALRTSEKYISNITSDTGKTRRLGYLQETITPKRIAGFDKQ
jgi:hypothetical protein